MISSRAKSGFDNMAMLGMRSALTGPEHQVIELITLPHMNKPPESHAVVLTLSSLKFRMLTILYFSHNDATRRHYASISRQKPEEMSTQAFLDTLCEAGNMCSGGINRDLGTIFPWVGMSTPNIVESHCTSHLGILKYGHLQHLKLSLDSGHHAHLSLCVSESEDLDFNFQIPEVSDQGSGELEIF